MRSALRAPHDALHLHAPDDALRACVRRVVVSAAAVTALGLAPPATRGARPAAGASPAVVQIIRQIIKARLSA
jgi:hypothetical protein